MDELSEEHRAVITLREVEGLDYQEIADAIGIPRGTVMSRLFYARKALQKALKEFSPSGADFNPAGAGALGEDQPQREDDAASPSHDLVKAR